MTETPPPNSAPSHGKEIEPLRQLFDTSQAQLDMDFVRLVGELRTGVEAVYLAIKHSAFDQEITDEADLRKTWGAHVVLVMHVARYLSVTAERVEKRVHQIMDLE